MKHSTDNHYRVFNAWNITQYSINCDWLQIHVKNTGEFIAQNTALYEIKRSGQTKVFKDVYDIVKISSKEHIASYATNPNSCILDKGHGILKFSNAILYQKNDLRTFVAAFLEELNFKFIGITRLDIAFDFHYFKNKRDPHNFIKSFLRDEILKIQRSQFRVAGEHNKKNTYNWIYFGSHKSDVSYKLYNKTGEQKAIGRKAWIWEKWNKKSFLDTNKTIWRLEFTVNSTQAKFANEFTECEFHSLDVLDHLKALFSGLFNHYFRFVEKRKATERKDRMKAIELIEFDTSFVPYDIERRKIDCNKRESGRTQKILINQLLKHHAELREVDIDFDWASSEMIKKLINLYSLEDWAKKKGIAVHSTDFVYPLPNNNYKNYSSAIGEVKDILEDG